MTSLHCSYDLPWPCHLYTPNNKLPSNWLIFGYFSYIPSHGESYMSQWIMSPVDPISFNATNPIVRIFRMATRKRRKTAFKDQRAEPLVITNPGCGETLDIPPIQYIKRNKIGIALCIRWGFTFTSSVVMECGKPESIVYRCSVIIAPLGLFIQANYLPSLRTHRSAFSQVSKKCTKDWRNWFLLLLNIIEISRLQSRRVSCTFLPIYKSVVVWLALWKDVCQVRLKPTIIGKHLKSVLIN